MEFCQWLKAYFEKNYNGEPYDAVGRRKGQDLFYIGGVTAAPVKKSAGEAPVKKSLPSVGAMTAAPKPKTEVAKEEVKKSESDGASELQA